MLIARARKRIGRGRKLRAAAAPYSPLGGNYGGAGAASPALFCAEIISAHFGDYGAPVEID
jgi:hypothetical protein